MNKGMKNFELFSDFKNHREQRGHREKFLSSVLSMSWYEEINNELLLTRYELTLPEFVSVRISSLFFFHYKMVSHRKGRINGLS